MKDERRFVVSRSFEGLVSMYVKFRNSEQSKRIISRDFCHVGDIADATLLTEEEATEFASYQDRVFLEFRGSDSTHTIIDTHGIRGKLRMKSFGM